MRRSRALAAALCLVALGAAGCITRPQKQEIFESGMTRIFLRSEVRWSTPVEKDYSHPLAIAPVRVSHILSRLDVRPPQGWLPTIGDDKTRVPALEAETIQLLAEPLSNALAEADSTQQVVVMAVRETKRWGIFDHDYLTSFVAYARDGMLYIHFSHFDWEIPDRRDDRLPEPQVGHNPQRFSLYPGTAFSLLEDRQSVAIDWQDPVFAQATRIQVGPDGELRRREILIEDPSVAAPEAALPADLSPEQLRALADLEEERRSGQITEADYQMRRRRIMSGGP